MKEEELLKKVPLEKLCLVDGWNQTHENYTRPLNWEAILNQCSKSQAWIDEWRQVPMEKLCFVDGRNQLNYPMNQISRTRRQLKISKCKLLLSDSAN